MNIQHFIKCLKQERIPKNCKMISFDVESLFTKALSGETTTYKYNYIDYNHDYHIKKEL